MKSYIHYPNRLSLLILLIVHGLIHAIAGVSPKLTVQAEFHVTLTCTAENLYGSFISLKNDVNPSLVYSGVTDSTGHCIITNIQTGQYTIHVIRYSYYPYTIQVNLAGNLNLNVNLQQIKKAPAYVHVNKLNLMAEWSPVASDSVLFSEDWSSHSFVTNAWTITGGINWMISDSMGNPAPAAIFNWTPSVQNYSQQLTSRLIPASHAVNLTLHYDFYLSCYACTTSQVLATEIWDGSQWDTLYTANSLNGAYPWTSMDIDISAYANQDIMIRFDSYGDDSFDINEWIVDNIRVVASSGLPALNPCVQNYKLYLNNNLLGTTTDTTFQISPELVQYGQTYQFCVKATYANGVSPPSCTSFTSEFLYPPRNLSGIFQTNTSNYWVNLTWEKPNKPGGTIPPGISGYKIYRGADVIHTALSADSLTFNDINPPPGFEDYRVTATYNLSSYGYPGTDESLPAGPDSVYVQGLYGFVFPFTEHWDQGTFVYNTWTFEPSQGNWSIDLANGYAEPSAKFSGTPVDTNYSYSLVSKLMDATPWTRANIWLDFDYKGTPWWSPTEHLVAEVWFANQWIKVADCNSGNEWYHWNEDISFVGGSFFKIRFRAFGENSALIDDWYVDNISVTASCLPPKNPHAIQHENTITLTWTPPDYFACGDPVWFEYDDGTAESSWAADPHTQKWFGVEFHKYTWSSNNTILKEFDVYFKKNPDHGMDYLTLDIFDQNRQWVGTTDAFLPPDNGKITVQTQGIIVKDTFFVMVHWNNVAHETNRLGYNQSDDYYFFINSWYYDGTTWQTMASLGESNGWFMINARGFEIYLQDNASQGFITGEGNDSYGSVLEGYNIYRSDEMYVDPFLKINGQPVTGTTYVDTTSQSNFYGYYIEAVFKNALTGIPLCTAASDTVTIYQPVGLPDREYSIRLYPNPVDDILTIESERLINGIELFDYFGRIVIEKKGILAKRTYLSFSVLPYGIYLLKFEYPECTMTRKIIKQ